MTCPEHPFMPDDEYPDDDHCTADVPDPFDWNYFQTCGMSRNEHER